MSVTITTKECCKELPLFCDYDECKQACNTLDESYCYRYLAKQSQDIILNNNSRPFDRYDFATIIFSIIIGVLILTITIYVMYSCYQCKINNTNNSNTNNSSQIRYHTVNNADLEEPDV